MDISDFVGARSGCMRVFDIFAKGMDGYSKSPSYQSARVTEYIYTPVSRVCADRSHS